MSMSQFEEHQNKVNVASVSAVSMQMLLKLSVTNGNQMMTATTDNIDDEYFYRKSTVKRNEGGISFYFTAFHTNCGVIFLQ